MPDSIHSFSMLLNCKRLFSFSTSLVFGTLFSTVHTVPPDDTRPLQLCSSGSLGKSSALIGNMLCPSHVHKRTHTHTHEKQHRCMKSVVRSGWSVLEQDSCSSTSRRFLCEYFVVLCFSTVINLFSLQWMFSLNLKQNWKETRLRLYQRCHMLQ